MDPPDPTPRHRHLSPAARRRTVVRRRVAGLAAVVVVVAATGTLVARASGPGPSAATATTARRHPPTTTSATVPATTTTVPPTTSTVDPGSLPQTQTFPSATDPSFTARMDALWNGVVTGSTTPALPAFFPQAAYVALKDEANPAGDYTGRLLADYQLDITAAHQLVGTGAALVGVDVDSAYGHWVSPGVCYNDIGYFEVPNARMVYSLDGQVRSFGIASMISWRGQWYVVHLGAVLRPGERGEVDDPQTGPGTSAYSSTC
ncbi:MAG TPA: hypothetical protein VII46_05060 [Acidimicrobiales bacterium]